MPLCKDEAISQLNSLGYDVVRLPRADLQPLDVVIERDGQFTRLAQLPRLWISESPVPIITEQPPGPNLKSVTTSQLKGRFGIQALIDVVKVGLHLSGKRQSSMRMVAQDLIVQSCPFDDILNYVVKGETDPANAAGTIFSDDSNRIWLVIEVIASSKLQIIVGEGSDAEAAASAAELTKTLSATAEISTATSSGNTIVYSRKTPLVFGFKTAEVIYENGWKLELPSPAGKKYMGKTAPAGVRVAGRRLALTDFEQP